MTIEELEQREKELRHELALINRQILRELEGKAAKAEELNKAAEYFPRVRGI